MNSILNEIDISIKFKKPKQIVILIISVVLIFILGITDYFSGYELSFSIFYLIPISFATLFSNRQIDLLISFISASVWLTADLLSYHTYSKMLIPFWNALMRLGYFVLHTFLLSKLLNLYQKTKLISLIDPLTNIANWRSFQEKFKSALQKANISNLPLALAYFDLDNFKTVNDIFGHSTGDDLLKMIASKTLLLIRPNDLISRIGGDEFTLLLPETNFNNAKLIIERVRNELLNLIREKKMASYIKYWSCYI